MRAPHTHYRAAMRQQAVPAAANPGHNQFKAPCNSVTLSFSIRAPPFLLQHHQKPLTPPATLESERFSVPQKPKLHDTLLGIARQAKAWLAPTRQSFATLPSGAAVPLWSMEFSDWFYSALKAVDPTQHLPAPVTYNRVIRQLEDDARPSNSAAHLRSAPTPEGYEIDLGGPVVRLTGKQWSIEPPSGTAFFRHERYKPIPIPTKSAKDLPTHLSEAFQLDGEKSKQLAQWIELALRPDTHCPPLVLTGECRDEAAEAIRELIDPVVCPVHPMPTHSSQLRWEAPYNLVLAFQLISRLTESKLGLIKSMVRGAFVRVIHSDKKKPHLMEMFRRPVILTAEVAPAVSRRQITLEINQSKPLPRAEVFAALLDQMVVSIRNERQAPEALAYKASASAQPSLAVCADSPGP